MHVGGSITLGGTLDIREGALRAVNLGDDADTTGAIYGQLAGISQLLSSIIKSVT
jgi:ADP-ribosylglycohydrolase